jgi:hypothetical protein
MQIDESNGQPQKAAVSKREIRDPGSNVTFETIPFAPKQPPRKRSIVFGIITTGPGPKYQWIDRPAKSTRKSPNSLKLRFPSPIDISLRFVPRNAQSPISTTPDGMKSDTSDEHRENTPSSILESFEADSNVTVASVSHRWKQSGPRISTDEGIQIDESDEQSTKALDPNCEDSEPDSNVTLETPL